MPDLAPHRIRFGGWRWGLWRRSLLRSAGLPAGAVLAQSDATLAAVMDEHLGEMPDATVRAAYRVAYERAASHLARLARQPLFREAVAWQSPQVVANALDKVVGGLAFHGDVPPKKHRQRLAKVASYLQRYALKNDTIGFFGPIGWVRWQADGDPFTVRLGDRMIAGRSLHFEVWAVDAFARHLSRDPVVVPWLRPALAPQVVFSASEGAVRDPLGRQIALNPTERRLLGLLDGRQTLGELARELLAGTPPEQAVPELHRLLIGLQDRELVRVDLAVSVSSWPESELRDLLEAIADPPTRAYALKRLGELEGARQGLQRAAGDPSRLATALGELNRTFAEVAASSTARRPGEMYAGRTIVYEDTSRDVDVTIGPALADELARPLELVLQSVRWLVTEAAEAYQDRFRELHDRIRRRTGSPRVPLGRLYSAAAPDLVFSFQGPPPLLAPLVEELQRRWQRLLRIPSGGGVHYVDSDRIRDEVAREFPATAARWSGACQQSPDVMIAAGDSAAVARGDYRFVLGEIHVAVNGLQHRPVLVHSTNPDWLLAAEAADHGERRVVTVPSKESPIVNSRTNPSALLSPRFTYWTMHPDPALHMAAVIPAAALHVVPRGDRLVVESNLDDRELDLLEVLGEAVSGALINGFRLLPAGPHLPRVQIDRLVVARETWRFDADELAWCAVKDPCERFLRAWRWHRDQGLPQRCFYRIPVEDKPMYVDFSSVVYLDMLARAVRRTTQGEDDRIVTVTEMLPDIGDAWLCDADGRRYTSELRLVLHDDNATADEGAVR